MTPTPILTISEELAGERLDRALASLLPDLSRSRLKALIEAGQLMTLAELPDEGEEDGPLSGQTVTEPSGRVKAGQIFALRLPEAESAIPLPQDIPLTILYEDASVIVINKPAGMVVHPAPGNADGTLVNALLYHCGSSLTGIGGVARPGIVHRIDKETSGILVVAKTDTAHAHLSAQFADHSVDRTYRAFVWGGPVPLEDRIEGAIGRHPTDRKRMAITAKGKPAVTYYETLARYGVPDVTLVTQLACRLETGRTHQIRVHLTQRGHPLLGDPVYGQPSKQSLSSLRGVQKSSALTRWDQVAAYVKGWERQALHAAALGFIHPVSGEHLLFESPLPPDLAALETFLEQA